MTTRDSAVDSLPGARSPGSSLLRGALSSPLAAPAKGLKIPVVLPAGQAVHPQAILPVLLPAPAVFLRPLLTVLPPVPITLPQAILLVLLLAPAVFLWPLLTVLPPVPITLPQAILLAPAVFLRPLLTV